MNNRDWIEKTFYGQTKSGNKSLYSDMYQNVYSYGIHYPLLFRVGSKVLINDIGYSNTTSKHINHAKNVEPDAIRVKLYPERQGYTSGYSHIGTLLAWNASEDQLVEAISGNMQHHLSDLFDQMDAKKRKDTQVYRHLEYQFDNIAQAIGEIEA